ncbi:cell wall surface anchor family protein [Trypanosoma conorhini]|uniref:Cell wall surface anchor family protein n=1 Tax=Trypanosoma conorhini TaxID=83891 RepID=A0A3R7L5G1_9TRYP|nr:cell wall surface anchor family protein [Trypanosoma conorhini]RNF21432.1 cell wall surface anchor family protein [Trypanosoma conorhini]
MRVAPLSLLFLLLGSLPLLAAARQHIVVDVDGSVEDYAALTSIAQSPKLRGQLSLVTVSGVTWGHAATLARNLCRFLSLAQLADVTVSVGAVQAAADAYDASLSRGGCGHSQGFPATPHDALRRGMAYSRADVTSCFGAAYHLPAKSCKVEMNASEALHAVLAGMSAGDTVVYLALASSTNLASALTYLGSHDPARLQRLKQSAVVHFLEKGYSLAVDDASTSQVLAEPGLRIVLYLSSFYDPAVTFSVSSWSEFSTMAKEKGASKAVAWLFSAWEAKKSLVESRSSDGSATFFRESGPASSLVTLCALDAAVRASCAAYRTALTKVSLHLGQPTDAGPGTLQLRITGNNVTWPSYLQATPRAHLGAARYLAAPSADRLMPPATTSLASVFMSVWSDLLRS